MMKKISIIVPIYNVKEYLTECLESLINQSLEDIEIICIDDCSTDGSGEILKEYASKDSRLFAIFNENNQGTSQARKNGVASSHGKYIMFVDGDDALEKNACEVAYNAIENKKTDIVHFNTCIENCAGVSEDRIRRNQKDIASYLDKIEDVNLINACWKERKFRFTLWNKIYNGDVCRKAFEKVEDGYFPKAQDLYAFFLIAFYAKTYSGINDVLYKYKFGVGVTGGDFLNIDKFEILLTEKRVCDALNRFLISEKMQGEYGWIIDAIYKQFLNECINKWRNNLKAEYQSIGFEKLVDMWGLEDVLCRMAETDWTNRDEIARMMSEIDFFRIEKKKEKNKLTIAAYYRSICNGGAQRVVARLCNIWAEMKNEFGENLYNVILITDGEREAGEYFVNEKVKREFLPDYEKFMRSQYRERFKAWTDIINRNQIDIVVSSMWVAPCTLWDMLCVKGHPSKPAFAIHCHSFCCLPYSYVGNTAAELMYDYQICDGVVTLSECDAQFVSSFSNNVKCISNPITFNNLEEKKSRFDENVLLWVGRLSYEKRPTDIIYMMEYVVKRFPEAKLYIVGGGNTELYKRMQKLIKDLKLNNNIIMTGFTQEIEEYYSRASVFIGTSDCEGFSMTFSEAMSWEIPIVTYNMPWLTFIQDGRGIMTVPQKRIDLLAEGVLKLLDDTDKLIKIGRDGKEQILEMTKINVGEKWKEFFDSIINRRQIDRQLDSNEKILYQYLSIYQQMGKNNIRKQVQNQKNSNSEKIKRELDAVLNSTTFKVGKIVMYIPIKIKLCVLGLMKSITKR